MKYLRDIPLTDAEWDMKRYIENYPQWISEIETLADSRQAIRYDLDRVQSFKSADETFDIAVRISDLQDKVDAVEHVLGKLYTTDGLRDAMRRAYCYRKRPKSKEWKRIYLMTRHTFYAEVRWELREMLPKEEG